MLETAAYYVALISVVAYPPIVLLWFWVHPLVRFWRKLGPLGSWVILLGYLIAAMTAFYSQREALLAVHFGVRLPLVVVAGLLLFAALALMAQRAPHLTPAIRMGLPELSRERPGKLLTEGIFAKVRHPTYLEGGLALAACALFSNYLAVYGLLLLYLPVIYLVALLEERELRDRFGAAYVEYLERVPRFFPRLRRTGKP